MFSFFRRPTNAERKAALISRVPGWWHRIDLGDGVVTPGKVLHDTQRIILSSIPADLRGKTVLDVGCWDGYYSFECERRGAASVLAIDTRRMPGFAAARRALRSRVKFRHSDFFELAARRRKFDVVLFFGVLYHLRNPLAAAQALFRLTRETLLIETHVIETVEPAPVMRFYPGKELNNDPSNWWGPNFRCVEEMFRVSGFRQVRLLQTFDRREGCARVLLRADR